MCSKSMFDCDFDSKEELERTQIIYDEDLFSFGNDNSIESTDSTSSIEFDAGKVENQRYVDSSNATIKRKSIASRLDFKVKIRNSNNNPKRMIVNSSNKKSTNKYDILKEIGSGTYGKVYSARDNRDNRIIAVKRIICEMKTLQSKTKMEFLAREQKHLREMDDCNNIVRLLNCYEERIAKNAIQIDLLFEYCVSDLRKIIECTRLTFQLSEVKCILRQILNGIYCMHEKMIMHRDIKTENILLTRDGIVKIADFGLTRKMVDPAIISLKPPQYTNKVVTLWYRAPEVILGDTQYTDRIDLWSLGCIMGEFWWRHPIFRGENEYHQLDLISRLCGTIDSKAWPNVINLKMFPMLKLPGPFSRKTRSYLTNIMQNEQANNFFDSLLECDPDKRHSAWTALNDDFFYSDPLPARNLKNFMSRLNGIPQQNNKHL